MAITQIRIRWKTVRLDRGDNEFWSKEWSGGKVFCTKPGAFPVHNKVFVNFSQTQRFE